MERNRKKPPPEYEEILVNILTELAEDWNAWIGGPLYHGYIGPGSLDTPLAKHLSWDYDGWLTKAQIQGMDGRRGALETW